jgi:hypothetical protein
MKCFYSEAEAVGICKSCGRGLSRAFATEFPKGLACANRCEAEVQRLIRADEAVPGGGSNGAVSGGFTMLAGGAFVYFSGGFAGGLSLPSFMGVVFFCYGLYVVARALVIAKRRRSRPPPP